MKKIIIPIVASLLVSSGCVLLDKNVAPKQSNVPVIVSTNSVSSDSVVSNAVVAKSSLYKEIKQKAVSKKGIIVESSILAGILIGLATLFMFRKRNCCKKSKC